MKIKKLLVILLTIIMVMGTTVLPVLADDTNTGAGDKIDNAVIELGEDGNPEAAITKSVSTGKDIEIPELEYTFRIVQVKNGTVADGAPGNSTAHEIDTVDFPLKWTADDTTAEHDGTVTIKPTNTNILESGDKGFSDAQDFFRLESGNLFDGVNVPGTPLIVNTDGVAIYKYTITEDKVLVNNTAAWGGSQQGGDTGNVFIKPDPATKTVGEFNETLTLSKAEYVMHVYTKNKADNSGRYIFAITVQQTKYDDGTDATNEPKKNPTPGGNPSVQGDVSELMFTNNYDKVEVTDPTNPNGQPYQLSKKVTGVNNDEAILTADNRQAFEFNLTVTLPAAPSAATVLQGRLWTSTNGSDWVPVEPEDGDAHVDITDGNYKYYRANGTQITKQKVVQFDFAANVDTDTEKVYLRNNEKITFPDAATGTVFDVEEKDYYANPVTGTGGTTYTLTPVVNEASVVNFATASDAEKLEARSDSQTVSSGPVASDYRNDGAAGTTPTGIIMQYMPFFIIIVLAVIALIATAVIKGAKKSAAR